MSGVREAVEVLARALTDRPDDVRVTESQHKATTLVELFVGPGDLGKVIGKQGRTAAALRTPITERSLAPGASVAAIVKAVERYRGVVIVVGHQPDLGRAAAQLVANARSEWSIEKGAVWWLAGDAPARIKAVVSADLL